MFIYRSLYTLAIISAFLLIMISIGALSDVSSA